MSSSSVKDDFSGSEEGASDWIENITADTGGDMRMTPSICGHKKSGCDSTLQNRVLSIAATFLWAIALTATGPTNVDAQSWLNKLEQAGKQILDRTGNQMSQPSEGQQGQQTVPAPRSPSNTNPSYTQAQVREVQRILLDLGYRPGPVDGTYAPATATAIRAYQSDHGLPQTGVPSNELLAHLRKTQATKLAAAAGQAPARSAPTSQTQQSSGGMIAPAPESAPITSAQERETKTAPRSSNQSLSSPSAAPPIPGEIDPLAPAGVTLGANLTDVGAALIAAGYRDGGPCAGDRKGYLKQVGTGHISIALYAGKGCPAGAAVSGITYRQTRIPISGSPAEIVGRAARRLGAEPKCATLNPRVAVCDWPSPPVAPAVKNVRLWYEGPSDPTLRIYLDGVADLQVNRNRAESRPAETGPSESKVKSSNQSSGFADTAQQSSQALQTANTMPSPGGFAPIVPASAAPGGALSDDVIPMPLLLYKYAPEAFTDKYLLEKAREQIHQDQWAYKHPNPATDHVFVFSREQVEGRAAEFAAKELLPVYKSYLARLRNQIPARLNFKNLRNLAVLEYNGGALRTKSQPYLSREFKLPEKRDIPRELQGREILGSLSQISGRIGNFKLGTVTKSFDNRGRGTLLALDRDPEVPPIAMKSADAERIWKKPECSPTESSYLRDGATRAAAAQGAKDCRFRLESYGSQPAIRTVFEIEIERVTVTERNWIVEARLIGASVYSPHQELLKTFGANDFVSVETKVANVQRKETQAAEERRSKIAELAHMDLLGVRLGMSVKEAETTLRAHQKIQTVYRFSAAPSPRHVGGTYVDPYNRGLLFIANEGKDVIALFFQNENTVIGISRKLFADDLKNESLTTALTKKYGKPTITNNHGWIWGQTEKGSACAGDGNIDARSKLELLEGATVANVTYKAAGISVRPDAAKADALAGCNTVLQVRANLAGTAKPNVEFRLFNHSTVAGALKEVESQTKSRATKAAKDLKL